LLACIVGVPVNVPRVARRYTGVPSHGSRRSHRGGLPV